MDRVTDREQSIDALEDYEEDAQKFLEGNLHDIGSPNLSRVIAGLRKERKWEFLVKVTEKLIGTSDHSQYVLSGYLQGLRGLSRHEDALQFGLARQDLTANLETTIQWASLLCEAGDFEAVIAEIEALASGDYQDSDEVLLLYGWACEQSLDHDFIQRGLAAYKKAVEIIASPSATKETASRHPGAYAGIDKYNRDFGKLKELWCRRGYATLLTRSALDTSHAAEWRDLIDRSLAYVPAGDPFVLRILGWSYYRVGEHEKAVSLYQRVLETGISPHGGQFEYALILFSLGSVSAALQQYRKAIRSAHDLSGLRRAGLLRVALVQFYEALSSNEPLWRKTKTRAIFEELTGEISILLDSWPQELVFSKTRIALGVERIRTATLNLLITPGEKRREEFFDWERATVVGIPDPQPKELGLLAPVVQVDGSNYLLLTSESAEANEIGRATLTDPPGEIRLLATAQPASPFIGVLYLSSESLKVFEQLAIPLPTLRLGKWVSVGSDESLAACVDKGEGDRILDQIAQDLIAKVIDVLKISAEDPHGLTTEWSRMSLLAARRWDTLYLAAICYASIAPARGDIRSIRDDFVADALPTLEDLSQKSQAFRELVKLAPVQGAVGADAERGSEIVSHILKRAAWITDINDARRRTQEAVWASAEVQAILPNDATLAGVRELLAEKLCNASVWYLSDTKETMALAKEAAFYCAMQRPELSKPALDVFAFFKASSNSDLIKDGPIAIRAKTHSR